jgi:hypothetical protein
MSTDRYYQEARLGPKHCMGRVFISRLGHIGVLHVLHTVTTKAENSAQVSPVS